MKVKVCGMRDVANINALTELPIDYIGFIFYKQSKRYVAERVDALIPKNIKKVGVFVNETVENIEQIVQAYSLNVIQLHGDETPEFCRRLHQKGYTIFKAFGIDAAFDFKQLTAYAPYCDYFLLDAKGKSYGGNGVQFNWQLLEHYTVEKPFFLSGGIDAASIPTIQTIKHPQLYGIDINSKFEISPALKNIDKIKQAIALK